MVKIEIKMTIKDSNGGGGATVTMRFPSFDRAVQFLQEQGKEYKEFEE